jgi:hypothetical protein
MTGSTAGRGLRYDPRRARARLALIEQQVTLERGEPDCCHKRARSSSWFPSVSVLVLAS